MAQGTSVKVILVMCLGVLALFGTVLSIILMILLRQTHKVITHKLHPTPYTPNAPYDLYDVLMTFDTFTMTLGNTQTVNNYFTTSAIPQRDSGSPAVSIADDPSITQKTPLRYGSHTFGHGVILPNASQAVISFGPQEATNGFGQLIAPGWFVNSSYAGAIPVALPSDAGTQFKVARHVGTVGFKSFAVSPDGLRLYTAYSTEFTNPTSSDPALTEDGTYPFGQYASRVQVFTRNPTSALDVFSPNSSTQSTWDSPSDLKLECPFGARTLGVKVIKPYTRFYDGDDFGHMILTSRRISTGARLVAVRSRLMTTDRAGAGWFVYEEQGGTHKLICMIALDELLFTRPGITSTFDINTYPSFTIDLSKFTGDKKVKAQGVLTRWRWEMIKQDFGRGCAMGDDTILCSLTASVQGQSSAVVCFRRSATTNAYELHSVIDSPSVQEGFGTSMVLDPTGTIAVIGSPALASITDGAGVPGKGGKVYLYALVSDTDFVGTSGSGRVKWVQTDVWDAPAGSDRAFGYFINTDAFLNVVCANANMDNRLDVVPVSKPITSIDQKTDPDFPYMLVRSIDKAHKSNPKFSGTPVQIDFTYFNYAADHPNTYTIDPLFGANASLALAETSESSEGGSFTNATRVHVLLSSPLNEVCGLWNAIAKQVVPSVSPSPTS